MSQLIHINVMFQPVVSGLMKKQKNTKQGNDDITLPLMEKNQGQHHTSVFFKAVDHFRIAPYSRNKNKFNKHL